MILCNMLTKYLQRGIILQKLVPQVSTDTALQNNTRHLGSAQMIQIKRKGDHNERFAESRQDSGHSDPAPRELVPDCDIDCLDASGGLLSARVSGLVGGQRCFFVADNSSMEGLITLHNLRSVPEDDVWSILQQMDENDVNQVPIMDNGSFLGVITRERLLHDIRLRAEFGV
jgi:hypothetical protein